LGEADFSFIIGSGDSAEENTDKVLGVEMKFNGIFDNG